jgi:cell division septum initiation protein DivIVA
MVQLSTKLNTQSFTTLKKGGYDLQEVHDYLDRLSIEVARIEEQLAISRTRVGELEKRIKGDQDAETVVQTAFLAAAEVKSRMLEEAETRAAKIISNAEDAAGSAGNIDEAAAVAARQEAQTILIAAKQKLTESDAEANRRIAEANTQAEQILALARRRALTAVGGPGDTAAVEEARGELQRLVFMINSLKNMISDGFAQADAPDASLKSMLGEAETLVGVVEGDQVGPATA